MPRPTAAAVVLVAWLAMSSCAAATLDHEAAKYLPPPRHLVCEDGWPVRVIIDPLCPHGLCGYTCTPTRWRDFPAPPLKENR